MKDAEDEAFDELAKRQGAWGGGFQAKRAMAADKNNRKRGSIALARQLCYEIAGATNGDDDFSGSDYGSVDVAEILFAEIVRLREVLAQPAQEPPSEWAGSKAILDEYGLQAIDFVADFKATLAQPAQEPVARVMGTYGGMFVVEPLNPAMVLFVGMALYSSPQGNK